MLCEKDGVPGMARILKALALYLVVLVVCLALYVPFRLLGEKYQQILVAGTSDFYYWFAPFIWPLFTLLLGGLPAYFGSRIRVPFYVRIPVYFLLLASWDVLPRLDTFLQLKTTCYLSSYTFNPENPGQFNTTYLSFILQPVCFFAGIVSGEVAGWLRKRRLSTKVSPLDPVTP